MRMNRFGDAGLPRRLPASLENAIGSDGAARVPAWEEPVGGPLPTPVRGESLPERLRQHDLPVFVAFAVANPDHGSLRSGRLQNTVRTVALRDQDPTKEVALLRVAEGRTHAQISKETPKPGCQTHGNASLRLSPDL